VPSSAPAAASPPKTILTVDDSNTMREMVTFVLESAGYRVIEAKDGASALDRLSFSSVDLVITDQNMPGMDGLALVRSLRAMRDYKSVPILVLTTESSEDVKMRGRAAGATGWLVKPFAPATLLSVVQQVLQQEAR
jgi:two-component system chemotaxis response regulator CheY